ncbi:peptidoglycan-N-acetylmuramic acid deacetylase PdaA [Clostridia bacterium]|nr:peptidoglycan-N-acetylmuramic acid deacetylase PdaA [Clostridia bacterium]
MIKICSTILAATIAVSNWGLSFQTPNAPPVADFDAAYLKTFDAAYIGDTASKDVYLTFDAGFENGQTPSILDTLKANAVPAAFFLVGNYFTTQPDLVRRMADEGHIVGNHTQHHPDMSGKSQAELQAELEPVETSYKQLTGKDMPKYYRPPQGVFSEQNLKAAQKLGYKTVFWSLAYVDWHRDKQPDPAASLAKLMSRLHGGAVILLHSTSQTNADILDEFIKKAKAQGYTFKSLDDLFA